MYWVDVLYIMKAVVVLLSNVGNTRSRNVCIAEGQIRKNFHLSLCNVRTQSRFCPRVGVNPGFCPGCRQFEWEEGRSDNDSRVVRLLMKDNFVCEVLNRKLGELEM